MKILCLDFDGVLHSYKSGWRGADVIPDPPVEGAIEFLYRAVEQFEVHIFSSRSCQPGGIEAMQAWISLHALRWAEENKQERWTLQLKLKWPKEKPPAFVSIDDRCLLFTGAWPDIYDLENFKPWNK